MKTWHWRLQSVLVGYVSKIELDFEFCCLLSQFYCLCLSPILEDLFTNDKKVRALHKELLNINLTISAYIEESQARLKNLRVDLANEAKSTQKVVQILSDICKE